MMEFIQRFIEGATIEPFMRLLEIFALAPENRLIAFGVITILFFINELLKTYLMIEHTRSVITHVAINIMTLLPAVLLIFILFYSGYRYPEHAWINLVFAILSFIPWYIAGHFTFLARREAEGADPGFMTVGLLMVISTGIITALVF